MLFVSQTRKPLQNWLEITEVRQSLHNRFTKRRARTSPWPRRVSQYSTLLRIHVQKKNNEKFCHSFYWRGPGTSKRGVFSPYLDKVWAVSIFADAKPLDCSTRVPPLTRHPPAPRPGTRHETGRGQWSSLVEPSVARPSANYKDRRYFTGNRVQRKLKWAFGTRSPFTEDSITALLYTVAVYGQSESVHRYPVIVYLPSATGTRLLVAAHTAAGSAQSSLKCPVSIYFHAFKTLKPGTEMNIVTGH